MHSNCGINIGYTRIKCLKRQHSFAKWKIIKADKKIYARIKTLELI